MLRVCERLKLVVPITFFLIFLPGYHISIAVWVGMIALMGLEAETGGFMLLFLDLSYYDAVRKGKMKTYDDLKEVIIHGTVTASGRR